jgi:HPt (histidine-containing phosphotransfer) domain-containing protein
MTLEEFYQDVGGSYEKVLSRLCSAALIERFVQKYTQDPTFAQLQEALAAQDWETAFRASHTLKGMAANLGFDRMYDKASALTEAMRGPKPLTEQLLWQAVQEEQERLLADIRSL